MLHTLLSKFQRDLLTNKPIAVPTHMLLHFASAGKTSEEITAAMTAAVKHALATQLNPTAPAQATPSQTGGERAAAVQPASRLELPSQHSSAAQSQGKSGWPVPGQRKTAVPSQYRPAVLSQTGDHLADQKPCTGICSNKTGGKPAAPVQPTSRLAKPSQHTAAVQIQGKSGWPVPGQRKTAVPSQYRPAVLSQTGEHVATQTPSTNFCSNKTGGKPAAAAVRPASRFGISSHYPTATHSQSRLEVPSQPQRQYATAHRTAQRLEGLHSSVAVLRRNMAQVPSHTEHAAVPSSSTFSRQTVNAAPVKPKVDFKEKDNVVDKLQVFAFLSSSTW